MSDVIGFLERMGQDARLRHADRSELQRALEGAQIELEARAAILDRDRTRLEQIVGALPNVCCLIEKPDDDDDEPEDAPQRDDDDDAEDSGSNRVSWHGAASAI